MEDKLEAEWAEQAVAYKQPRKVTNRGLAALSSIACSLVAFDLALRWHCGNLNPLSHWKAGPESVLMPQVPQADIRPATVVEHNLTLSQAWRNPDGGRWRPMYVGNSETPFRTINAREGDLVRINLFNEVSVPWTLHWIGLSSNTATWNDGSAGVSTYAILPRANMTTEFNTTGQWGLKWCLDHVSVPSVEGNYGTMWIAPSPERERPYKLISDSPDDLRAMMDAEDSPEHVTVYNYMHRQLGSMVAQLQGEGYDPYCYQSVLINGKGRVHCKPDSLHELDGQKLDSWGCVPQASGAVGLDECKPTSEDYEIIETGSRRWMMINFVNSAFEHVWHISIDDHEMWVVADDGGFVHPKKVDILHLIDGKRITVMVKLDKDPQDYAIRYYSYSKMQAMQGYSILRYPHKRSDPLIGDHLAQPKQEKSVINYDGTPKKGVVVDNPGKHQPYPPQKPPQKADKTLRFTAFGAPDPNNPYVTNCSLNGAPWQLFREFMEPMALHPEREASSELEPVVRGLPMGSVIDIILENALPYDLPFYKHNNPTFLLGTGHTKFPYESVAEGLKKSPEEFNLENPARGYMHEIPANGWMAIRWKIDRPAITMFAVYKVRYFIQGMQVALMEGDDVPWPKMPERIRAMPHVDFEMPKPMGIFD